MPGPLRDHADRKLKRGVRAGETVVNENILPLPEIQHPLHQPVEMGFGHRLIHRAPVHRRFGAGLADNVLVLGRAARELAGAHYQRATFGKRPFFPLDRLFHQLRVTQIPVL